MAIDWSKHIQNANWPMVFYITFCHALAIAGIYAIPKCSWSTLAFTFVLAELSGLGITGGAHRLWSHRAFKAHWTVRVFLMLCNMVANQGTVYHWSRDHRVHHKYSESDADPHNALRGMFFAHMGWLLVKKDPKVIEAGNKLKCDDLLEMFEIRWQMKLNPWGNLFMSFAFPMIVCNYYFNESLWNGLVVAGFLRYVAILHCTWLVNSAAHFYGETPYDPNIHPTENAIVALLAIGEGWHNWHHVFPYDYAASEFGIASQYNPTKLFIDTCAKLGLVTNRKRALKAWEQRRAKREATKAFDIPDGYELAEGECEDMPKAKAA
ncbi:acyl-CoA desaturase [Thraustotheca clavata]|uniref:Acyl-CoA desaturase n=1 Tax=Thraustotheca clavata TaxID=74557 RepID=A0A1W0A4Z0_9STRA|nr:acyl-CoA desaturase [Thraustotheca clavata]